MSKLYHVVDVLAGRNWILLASSEKNAKQKILNADTGSDPDDLEATDCGTASIIEVKTNPEIDIY